jgi:adenosylmethionine-8-amino-7-oxononanoate aminotransferase
MDQNTQEEEVVTRSLLDRSTKHPVPRVDYARGNKYYRGNDFIMDISGGAGVSSLGLSNHMIISTMKYQLDSIPSLHSSQFKCPASESAADVIMEELPEMKGGGVTFYSGGAEAIEAACRAAIQYLSYGTRGVETCFIGREGGYHGNSVLTLALGQGPRRATLNGYPIGDMLTHFKHFKAGNSSAGLFELADLLTSHNGPAVVIVETIGGTASGITPYDRNYLTDLRSICNKYGAVLIYDEILCGNFRTGDDMCAFQNIGREHPMNIAPDILVLGKGITGGYFPMSAVVISEHVREVLDGDGGFSYTSTNQNHPVGCAAVVAAIAQYRATKPHRSILHQAIARMIQSFGLANVESVEFKGMGSLWGLQFARGNPGLDVEIKALLMARGIACYTSSKFDKGFGNMILVAPAVQTTEDELHRFAKEFLNAYRELTSQ